MEVETTADIDEVLDYHQEGRSVHDSNVHRSADERMGCKKCKEGQRRRRKEAEAYGQIYNMRGIPVSNLGHTHRIRMGQGTQEYTCPATPPTAAYDPSLNCMRDARGNAVCSDGLRYPPGCPHTPPDQYFTPGVTPDVVNGGILEGQVPPPRSGGASSSPSSPGGGPSTATVVAAGAGALGLGALLFVLFR